jgi:hypothetical protein
MAARASASFYGSIINIIFFKESSNKLAGPAMRPYLSGNSLRPKEI